MTDAEVRDAFGPEEHACSIACLRELAPGGVLRYMTKDPHDTLAYLAIAVHPSASQFHGAGAAAPRARRRSAAAHLQERCRRPASGQATAGLHSWLHPAVEVAVQPGALVLTSYVPAGTLHVSVGASLDDRMPCGVCEALSFDIAVRPVVRSSPNLLIGSAGTLQFEATLWQP